MNPVSQHLLVIKWEGTAVFHSERPSNGVNRNTVGRGTAFGQFIVFLVKAILLLGWNYFISAKKTKIPHICIKFHLIDLIRAACN